MGYESVTFAAPGSPDNSDGGQWYSLGSEFESSQALPCVGVDWFCPPTLPTAQCRVALYTKADKGQVALSALFTPLAGVVNRAFFVAPVALLVAPVRYSAAVLTNRYAFTAGPFPGFTSLPNGYVTLPTGVNGRLKDTSVGVMVYPDNIHGTGANFHVSPVIDLGGNDHTKGSEFLTFF
jgi:hypothetical protein